MILRVTQIFLCGVLYCLLSPIAWADSHILLLNKEIPRPIYRNLYESWLNVGSERYRSITFELAQEKWIKKFKQQDYENCTSTPCRIYIMDLPLILERVTCSIKATFEDFSGVQSVKNIPWGKCENDPTRPDDRLLSDLALDEYISSPTSFKVSNLGASITNKQINISSYIEDVEGNVIWADSFPSNINLLTSDELNITSQRPLKTWQEKLGCRAHIFIDDQSQIQERSKKNNSVVIDFGFCEALPNQAAGDRFDFQPVVEETQNGFKFSVINHGRLPIQYGHEILEYEIYYKDNAGKLVFKRTKDITAPLYGFGDSKTVLTDLVPANACQFEILVNNNLLLKESNYQNNRLSISHCNDSGEI